MWLPALLHLNAVAGVEALERTLEESTASKTGAGVSLFAELFDRDYGGIGVDLGAPGFTPPFLLQLLRLAYQHVRIEDDVVHEGSYSPDTRDNAEESRNAVLSALLSTTGPEGWAVKLEMAADPLFDHIKDRIIALAEERAAEEADNVALTEPQFAILDKTGESPPARAKRCLRSCGTGSTISMISCFRISSPRELWASITTNMSCGENWRACCATGNQCYTSTRNP